MERRLNIFWPLTLIAAGVLWILIETGKIPASNLWALAYLWPFLLIGAGLGLILRPYWYYARPLISLLVVALLFLAVIYAGRFGWDRGPSYAADNGFFFGGPVERGSGRVITQTREVQDISSIHIDYPATVLIHQGSTEALTIEAEDNVAAAIRAQVVSHVLEIDSVLDHRAYMAPTRPVNITITVKNLTDIHFDSAGEITLQGLRSDSLTAVLNGAGSMALDNLQLGSLQAVLSGVGSLHASGTADKSDVRVDGLGSFDGARLRSHSVTVRLNGLGNADVWADAQLTAYVNGLGSVNYYGNPQVSKTITGLGSVQSKGTK